jgi:translation elongation factor EF-1alpha
VEAGTIKKGDTLMVTGPAFGLVKNKMEKLVVNGEEASEAYKGDRITFEITEKITAKDKLYKIIESELV